MRLAAFDGTILFPDGIAQFTAEAIRAWQGAGHLGVDRSEVEIHTFGDSWNDLPMHAIADRSYSFPWSPEEVYAATDEVIDSVAETLRRLL
ncbi:hypothetical protein [Corynebacterium hylobatis]|uniref:hypothetical protein n=1 Tax=Corynebacterium hylobatis TaxID=1859290 RepID=UPI001F49793A|nr:hypothetical protein [Corynebacterium hylobatis]